MSKRKADTADSNAPTPEKKPRDALSEAWATVDAFRQMKTPSGGDIVRLERCMVDILQHHDVERHCLADGLSQQFHRYRTENNDMAPKKELKHLRLHYWARSRQLRALKRVIDKKETAIQKTCKHKWERDWEDRDHRSHWECKKCGAYR